MLPAFSTYFNLHPSDVWNLNDEELDSYMKALRMIELERSKHGR